MFVAQVTGVCIHCWKLADVPCGTRGHVWVVRERYTQNGERFERDIGPGYLTYEAAAAAIGDSDAA